MRLVLRGYGGRFLNSRTRRFEAAAANHRGKAQFNLGSPAEGQGIWSAAEGYRRASIRTSNLTELWVFGSVMTATARELLRRKLSPQAYQYLSFYWWHIRFYLPRLVASIFVQRTPKIQGFSGGHTSEPLLYQLLGINVFAPTKMCRVMTKHGSDKGRGWHNYTTIYSALFGKLRDQPLLIFELGLGTNNPKLTSSMGVNARPGASLHAWRQLFPHALVYGADIDRHILFEEDRIKTFYCDQLDSIAIRDLWSQPVLQGGMDIIIDDGLHTFEANTSFLGGSLEHLRPGEVYVIEDILHGTTEKWHHQLETIYSKRFPNHEFALVALPNSFNNYDNNLLIIRKSR